MINPLLGRPGVSSVRTSAYGEVFRWADDTAFFPGGGVIDGTKSRDYGNAANLKLLRPGLLMGKVTASGEYAPSILGVLQSAAAAAATSITVTAAQAVEIVRRIGATGTLRLVGPPTAAGTVATFTETYSAVNTGTGVITVSGLDAALIAGSFVAENDGSYLPKTAIPGSYGIEIPEVEADVDFPRIPFRGLFEVTKIIDYPSDASLKQWLKDSMAGNGGGQFTFSDNF